MRVSSINRPEQHRASAATKADGKVNAEDRACCRTCASSSSVNHVGMT